jgi:hypothetical protein
VLKRYLRALDDRTAHVDTRGEDAMDLHLHPNRPCVLRTECNEHGGTPAARARLPDLDDDSFAQEFTDKPGET